jgi:hypothetical protein
LEDCDKAVVVLSKVCLKVFHSDSSRLRLLCGAFVFEFVFVFEFESIFVAVFVSVALSVSIARLDRSVMVVMINKMHSRRDGDDRAF